MRCLFGNCRLLTKGAKYVCGITPEQAVARTRTSWQRGQSGNPAGRPKVVAEIRDAARNYGADCIAQLVNMAGINGNRGASNEAVRLGAVRELLDRGFGKATQHIAGDEATTPLAIDFCWADAAPHSTPTDASAGIAAEQVPHRTVAGAVQEDANAVDMVTCGNA
jgi:hypothetical protein